MVGGGTTVANWTGDVNWIAGQAGGSLTGGKGTIDFRSWRSPYESDSRAVGRKGAIIRVIDELAQAGSG